MKFYYNSKSLSLYRISKKFDTVLVGNIENSLQFYYSKRVNLKDLCYIGELLNIFLKITQALL